MKGAGEERIARPYLEETLILHMLLGRSDDAARLAPECDWQRAALIAKRESVGGYLHRMLQTQGPIPLLPASFLDAVAVEYRKTAFDNLLLLGRLREAAGALSAADVPFLVLKGGALLADLYPDAGMRALTDIDILVPSERIAAARAALDRLGWRRTEDTQVAARRCGYESPAPGACLFEVHWDLSQRHRFQADLDRLWRDARPFQVDGVKAARLGDADELLYLSLHYAAHYFGLTVKWLVDLVELIRRRPPDWEHIGQRARAWRGSVALRAALLFVQKAAPELVSHETLERVGNRPVLDKLLACYASDNPLRFFRDLPRGPSRLLLATILQDRFRDRFALAWLTQVRGHRDDD